MSAISIDDLAKAAPELSRAILTAKDDILVLSGETVVA